MRSSVEGATRWRREREYEVRRMMEGLRRSLTYLGLYIGYCCLTLETDEHT